MLHYVYHVYESYIMSYILPPLPYAYDALEPFISKETLHFHHDKHHAAYVNKLNELTQNNSEHTLEHLIRTSSGALFNQAAQVWNHTFYWSCMSAQHNQKPQDALLHAITDSFGSVESFITTMHQAALSQFGSGWAWLILDEKKQLSIVTTSNADCPLRHQQTPLLVIDVWEHAYYIDTRNNRGQYIENFWSVVNWAFVAQNYNTAMLQTA